MRDALSYWRDNPTLRDIVEAVFSTREAGPVAVTSSRESSAPPRSTATLAGLEGFGMSVNPTPSKPMQLNPLKFDFVKKRA